MRVSKFKRRLRLAGIPVDELVLPVTGSKSSRQCRIKVIGVFLSLVAIAFYVSSLYEHNWRRAGVALKSSSGTTQPEEQEKVKRTKTNSSVVYLADSAKLEELRRSLKFLFSSFLSKYKYNVIVFFHGNDMDNYYRQALLSELRLPEEQQALISFEQVDFQYPPGFSNADLDKVVVWSPAFPAYNHAVAFWSYHVFQHPAIRNLDYFWRLDVDVDIFQPVQVDLFDLMRQKHYLYGFRHQGWNQAWSVQGLAPLVQDFVREKDVKPAQPVNLEEYLTSTDAGLRTYYSSFEILHVPTFLREDLQAFRLALFNTKRIYTHRWSDAAQRYAMVNLFLPENQVHRVCESAFEHQNIRYQPSC